MPKKETATSAGALARRLGRAAGGGGVAATPLFAGEDVPPVVSTRNGSDAGEEDTPARARAVTTRPDGA
uniref:Uncharacterized protein n=1 Tax=Oryza rufipogon TaxID=4529 RepID=A0A0E0RIC8_ORYRU